MKLRIVLPMLVVATFALAACASKVDYAKFHEDAVAADKEDAGYKKFTIKGYEKESLLGVSTEVKLDHVYEVVDGDWKKTKGEDGAGDLYAIKIVLDRASGVGESDDCTYYAGGSFKVEYKSGLVKTYDKFGYLTSAKAENLDYKVTWSK